MESFDDLAGCKHCGLEWDKEYEYCPRCHRNFSGAEYPEEISNEEFQDTKYVESIIRNAFNNVLIEDGMTIHEADLEGAFTDDSVRIEARKKDKESSWNDVPDWKLERYYTAPAFLDKKGFRFYLPAFMIWCLKFGKTSDSLTIDNLANYLTLDNNDYLNKFSFLDTNMSYSVHRFLEHLSKYYRQNYTAAIKALNGYWRKFSSP